MLHDTHSHSAQYQEFTLTPGFISDWSSVLLLEVLLAAKEGAVLSPERLSMAIKPLNAICATTVAVSEC